MTIQPSFVGDSTDATDKALIAAFGDPQVNIAGNFTDPSSSGFSFQFPITENYVGVTTQLSSQPATFTLALPTVVNPNQYSQAPIQGQMTCITTNPSEAATAWQTIIVSRISAALAALRAKTLVPTISDVTV